MKKITFLFALLCASVMGWATQYCGETLTATDGVTTVTITCTNPSTDTYVMQIVGGDNFAGFIGEGNYFELSGVGGNQVKNNTDETNRTCSFDDGTKTLTVTLTSSSTPKMYTPLYLNISGEKQFTTIQNQVFEWPASCSGGSSTPDPDPDPTPVDPNAITAGGHTISLEAYYVNDIYTLNITSTDAMEGLGGSFWYVNGASTDMRSNDATKSYTVSGDKKTITCQVQSNSAPSIHTPLYVLMPGEINFGSVTLNWEDRTPINSEYCNYQDPQTIKNGKNIALTWETDGSGNVVITMSNGTGASSCSFRNGGFEGGINAFVVSDDDFATTTPASNYFTAVQVYSGNTYTLTKTADLPANAKIKHVGSGHALAWVLNGNNEYCFPDFIYTYGGICNQLDAPTNVVVAADSTITFDAVTGADKYTAYVSLSGVEKYNQEVASGDKLHFVPYVDGDYDVTVIASGAGKVDSDPSTAYVWNLDAIQIVLGNSEYCTHLFGSGNQQAALTWETDGDGNIVITISDVIDGTNDPAHFRGNGMAIGNFEVGAGKTAASNYFNHACSENHVTLSLKNPANAPALGEKIYFNNHVVEYTTKQNTNAYGNYTFEYTYGTVCSGKAVSATPNNNTMGTAVVQKAGVDVTNVDEGDEVSFVATVADAELYRFVNWTKGGVEVSTNATYVTTITESTNLIANFDYIRNTYCHAEINSIQNKKLYMTLGAIGGGQYQIKFEGSAEAQLTGLNNANYTVNRVTTEIVDGDKKMSGQDVPFTNARWNFSNAGYGSATMVFGIQDGYTWEDIYVWNHAIYFSTAAGEVGYTGFPDRYHIAWTETCADEEDPVLVASGAVLNETSVRLTMQATDNWEGKLTYTISCQDLAEDIVLYGASGEELTHDITGLVTGTEYTFYVTVSDGTNVDNIDFKVTPVGDETKPVMGEASLESKTWNSAIINVAATDNVGVASFYIVELDADFVASEGKITVEGLTQGTAYTFTIKAKDAAGNVSDNSAEVVFSTDVHLTAPDVAAPTPAALDDKWVRPLYTDAYTSILVHTFALQNWGSKVGAYGEVSGNNYIIYDFTAGGNTVVWGENNASANAIVAVSGKNAGGTGDNTGIDASTMEKLHIDVWSNAASNNVEVRINDNMLNRINLSGNGWESFELTLSEHIENINTTSVRWMKFTNISGAENIAFDNVYFWKEPVVDSENPVMGEASVDSERWNRAIINVAATDNDVVESYYVVEQDAEYIPTAGKITITNLNPSTAYTLHIKAKDAAGNVSDNSAEVSFTTLANAPATAAPASTQDAALVKSLYSDTYTFAPTSLNSYNENWWDAPNMAQGDVAGNHYLHYNLYRDGMIGVQFANLSVATMEKIHIDIWASAAGSVTFRPITNGGPNNIRKTLNLLGQQWNSFDIEMSEFDGHIWADLYQYTIENYNAGGLVGEYIAVDNVYFYRETPLVDDEDPTNLTASVAHESFYSVKLNVRAEDNSGAVNFSVMDGENEVATGASASGVATTITVANLTPGTAYSFKVIAKDEANNAIEQEGVVATTLAAPAAAPAPTYPAGMVMSVYSDAYAPVVNVANYCEWWWESPTVHTNHTLGEGDHVLFYDNNHQAGASFGWSWSGDNKINFTNYQKLHLSVFPSTEGTIELYPVVQPEAQFHKVSQTLVAGQWNDIVLDYTDKTFAPLNQIGFINFYDLGEFFVDNVYFFAEAVDLSFADDADNATVVAENAGKWVNATINRSLLANGEWFTLCLPFDMNDAQLTDAFGADYTLTTMTGAEDRGSLIHLNFENVYALEAGKPYLIRPAQDFSAGDVIDTVMIKNVDPAAVKSANDYMEFQGTFNTTTLNQDNQRFVGPENYLYSPAVNGTSMKSFRCYFTIPEGEQQNNVMGKRARIVFGPQTATDIENIQSSEVSTQKVLRDGQLLIIRDARTYNAQGQLVK